MSAFSISDYLLALETDRDLGRIVCHRETIPARAANYHSLQPDLPRELWSGLHKSGVRQLYAHQAAAIEAARNGDNVVVVTPTASGKSLSYVLPILERVMREPAACSLLLFPLKALEQDQKGKLDFWKHELKGRADIGVEIYDGDTPQAARAKIKKNPPQFLITNPDMLHQAILGYHQGWDDFLKRLKFIVIDELHAYRGVFGSHILQVFKRLARLLHYHGANPQFICLSATIANPQSLAETLTDRKYTLIDRNGAPAAEREFCLVNSGTSTTAAAAKLLMRAVDAGQKTILFTKARVQTEVIHRIIIDSRPDLRDQISSYRAGFLPEERREIEKRLSTGELSGVISTSALELGIDIGGLDLCILAGYPGSMMSFWQRAGRVGRRDSQSAIILVAGYDQLDQYFVSRPTEFLRRPCEAALVNEANEEILRAHLPAAAAEIPLMAGDPFIDVSRHADLLQLLEAESALLKSASGKQWFPGRARPHSAVNLRNVGATFDIRTKSGNKPIGQVSGGSVFRECHTGAIYLHRGEQFAVEELDLSKKQVIVAPTSSQIYTMARSDKVTEIIDVRESRSLPGCRLHRGKVKVTETFHSYERRRVYSQELLSVEPLELPPQSFVTDSVWVELPKSLGTLMARQELHFMGGIHAMEHATISLIPLFALCDRNDIGGISFTKHPQLPDGAVFFYDGYPGGAGIATFVYGIAEQIFTRTQELIANCPCEEGCPSCIQSPKCGSGNKPLDKRAAIRTLAVLLSEAEVESMELLDVAVPPVAAAPEPELAWAPRQIPTDRRVLVFDIETQLSADEVGGWNSIRFMRVAVASVWDSTTGAMRSFSEAEIDDLIALLQSADLVVGYNLKRFDYEVLRGYTFANLGELPTLDLLIEVQNQLGFRLKLDSLTRATLGEHKSADGLQSLQWFREGKLDLVREYCEQDVALTRDLLAFALQNGYVMFERKDAGAMRIPLRLDLSNFLKKAVVAA